MARMTEPVIKWRSDGKWHGQYSGQVFTKVEEKGGETWADTLPEVDAIVHENCGKAKR